MINIEFTKDVAPEAPSRKGFAPILFLFLAIVVLALGTVGYLVIHKTSPSGPVACTQEAKICPDGSSVGRTGPNCEFAICPPVGQVPASSSVPIDTSSWKLYQNNEFGLSFKYPSTWQRSGDVLTAANPHIFFGNPLNGTTTYALKVFVLNNPQNLSAADFVKQMLVDDTANDASAGAADLAPQTTPQFARQYAVTVGPYPGYELYSVFEFDHQGEQVYVQQNKQMVMFDFPTVDTNPNIANAAANNAVAHRILGTLQLDPAVWKFCGGIAAFRCAAGYACELDGSFPDAGGHCVKQ